jgi:hypothetical protein
LDYIDYITSNHSLYDRYYENWKLCLNSWFGGVEYKNARYLRAYQVDFNQPNETINTYVTNDDGSVVSKVRARVEYGQSSTGTDRGTDVNEGTFYGEKLDNTPLYNYVKLIVAEYNALLYRNAPQRTLPETAEVDEFMRDVDGEGSSLNEFMSLVDMMTTIFGVCHVGCYKPIGSDIPKWRMHTPLDVTNWSYRYDIDGNLKLNSIVIKVEQSDYHTIYRHITPTTMETVFVGDPDSKDYVPPVDDPRLEHLDDNTYRIIQENELGYIPVKTIYQSTKVYNNVGTTVIQDVAQIQRSIYGDMAEIYSAITYGAHPTLVVDENTDQLNDGQIAAEPGSVVRVGASLTGEPAFTYQFVAPPLGAIGEIKDLVDSKIEKLSQIAMLRSEDMIKSSSSGYQIEVYDDKLASLIRRKATNLENAESKLWKVWADWMNVTLPEDSSISYSKQYNKKAIEHEIKEITDLMGAYTQYSQLFGDHHNDQADMDNMVFATVDEAQAQAQKLGGRGFHEYVEEDGTVYYMPFDTHAELEAAIQTQYPVVSEDANGLKEDLRDKIRQRLMELVNSTSTNNSL